MTWLINHEPACDTDFVELPKIFRNTFPTVRRKDEGRYGEYRTRRLVCEPLNH
jgi:hypothetical protein